MWIYICFIVTEKEQASASNVKAWMIGGFIVAAMLITIIGTLITIFIVKRRKGLSDYCYLRYF